MVRILGGCILRLVTGIARTVGAGIGSGMTGYAFETGMAADQRKTRRMFVGCAPPGERAGVVAVFTVHGEPGLNMSRIGGGDEVSLVTALTIGRRRGVLLTFLVLMTCLTVGDRMNSG